MTHYVAIVEEEPGKAVGIWFPDLPGCFTAGDTVDEALLNARDALTLWADVLAGDAKPMPTARTVTELKADPQTAIELETFIVALVPFEPVLRVAAE